MRLLAIDASTWWGGAALLEAEGGEPQLVAEIGVHVEDSHAARLLPLVEGLLATAAWPKTSLDAYAAVRGPGLAGDSLVWHRSAKTGSPGNRCKSRIGQSAQTLGPAKNTAK